MLLHRSNTDISVVQVGEDYFAEQQGVTQFANCAITDGLLTCGSASIPTGQFCNVSLCRMDSLDQFPIFNNTRTDGD